MNPQQNKRLMLMVVGIVDIILSGAILLIYFGLLPIDISEWGIPRWVIGIVGGVWFLAATGLVVYQLTITDISE